MPDENKVNEPEPSPQPTLEQRFDRLEAAVSKIADAVVAQSKRVTELAERPAASASAEAQARPEELPPGVQPLPDGTVRFWSRFKEYGIWLRPFQRSIIDGKIFDDRGHFIQFSNGLFDTNDEEEITFLRSCDDFARGIILEDPTARPHPGPIVIDGPKGTAHTPRAREELTARL
jgi:hypothetical protein